VVDPELVGDLLAVRRADDPVSRLTARQRDVLELMAQGFSDKGIAERLYLSPHTVGTHVQHIFSTLGLPDGVADNRRVLAVLTYLQLQ
jgi:DNA-binding NarL/FixJ family response regulator